jgi:hypothetical protein
VPRIRPRRQRRHRQDRLDLHHHVRKVRAGADSPDRLPPEQSDEHIGLRVRPWLTTSIAGASPRTAASFSASTRSVESARYWSISFVTKWFASPRSPPALNSSSTLERRSKTCDFFRLFPQEHVGFSKLCHCRRVRFCHHSPTMPRPSCPGTGSGAPKSWTAGQHSGARPHLFVPFRTADRESVGPPLAERV